MLQLFYSKHILNANQWPVLCSWFSLIGSLWFSAVLMMRTWPADKNSCVASSLQQNRGLCHGLFDTKRFFLLLLHVQVTNNLPHPVLLIPVTHDYTCCVVFPGYSLQHTVFVILWSCVCVCVFVCRGFPLASGWYLDAGWRWSSGAPFPRSAPRSPWLPTHHTARGWHHRWHTLPPQAGVHGECRQTWAAQTLFPTLVGFLSLSHCLGI